MLFELPFLPPSSNHMYINTRGGGRALSPKGRAWKVDTAAYLSQRYGLGLPTYDRNSGYVAVVTLYLPLFTETYGKKGGAKSRYKKVDTANRWKILADVLLPFLGLDDSQLTTEVLMKKHSLMERTTVEVSGEWETLTLPVRLDHGTT